MNLPEAFLARMKKQLGAEYDAFVASYDVDTSYGLRLNLLKGLWMRSSQSFLLP